MITIVGDFYSNFSAATRSHDYDAIWNIYMNELSTLLAHRRDKVLELLKANEIKVKDVSSDEDVIRALTSGLATNKKFRIGISKEIADQNNLLSAMKRNSRRSRKSSATGKPKAPKAPPKDGKSASEWADLLEGIGSIIKGTKPVVDSLRGDSQSKNRADREIHQQLMNKSAEARYRNEKTQARKRQQAQLKRQALKAKKTRQAVYGTLIGLALIGGGYAFWRIRKARQGES